MNKFFAQLYKIWALIYVLMLLFGCNSKNDQVKHSYKRTELDKLNVYVIAGDYYEIKIGVKGDLLTGVYIDPKSNDKNSCLFFFEGKIGLRNPVKIKCYNPTKTDPVFNGDLKLLGDDMIARLKNPPTKNCDPEFTDEVGHSVVLDLQHNWLSIRMIQQETYLYENFDGGLTVGNALIKGTVVAVIEKYGSWLKVEVQDKQNEFGWIQEFMLYPLLEL